MFQDVDYEISSVVEACRCMTSDKIIERRRAAELLQKLFSNESYIIRLDLNTDTNLGFTWNDVFEAAVNHFKKEVEKFKSDEEKGVGATQSARTGRENQLKLGANHLLNIIVVASERKPRLDIEMVLRHCFLTLKDGFLFEKFGRDHLNALNRELLPRRRYWSQLKPNTWLSLFLIVLRIFRGKVPSDVTYVSLASVLNCVCRRGVLQSDVALKLKKKMGFFVDVLTNKEMIQKEHHLFKIWVDTAVHLALALGYEDRLLACRFTETTLNVLLDSCHDNFEDMELVVQYSLVAMIAHHPCNAGWGRAGFLSAGPVEDWRRLVRRLHSLTDFIVKNMSQRNKTAERAVHELGDDHVDLAVRVAFQMMTYDSAGPASSSEPPSSKKKRLMSSVEELIDRVKSTGACNEAVPWLQVTVRLVTDHPALIRDPEMRELIQHVVSVTHDNRQYEMVGHAFKLLRCCCMAMQERGQRQLLHDLLPVGDVSRLWDSVCKCLAARRCREEGLLLLAALLHCRLLTGTSVEVRGVVDLLLKKFVGCDRASMVCLAALLQHYPLPDLPAQADRIVSDETVAGPAWNLSGQAKRNDRHRSSRSLLLEWLLVAPVETVDVEAPPAESVLRWRLLTALLMRQTPAPDLDVTAHLKTAGATAPPGEFRTRCRRLESFWNAVELLQQEQERCVRSTKAVAGSYLPVMVRELTLGVNEVCAQHRAQLDGPRADDHFAASIGFLSLVRLLVVADVWVDYSSGLEVHDAAVALLEAALRLVFGRPGTEDVIGTRRRIRQLVDLFSVDVSLPRAMRLQDKKNTASSSTEGEDFLRRAAWSICCDGAERWLSPAKPSSDGKSMGSIRRAFVAHPKMADAPSNRLNGAASNLWSEETICGENLSDAEGIAVDASRLLATLCCPQDPKEAAQTHYGPMKSQLLLKISQHNSDSFPLVYSVLRSVAAAPVETVDGRSTNQMLELTNALDRLCGHDHEVAVGILQLLPRLCLHAGAVGSQETKMLCITLLHRFRASVRLDLVGPPVERAFYECLAQLWPADPAFEWLLWSPDDQEEADEDGPTPIVLETLNGLNRPLGSTVVHTSQVLHLLFDEHPENDGQPTKQRHRWLEKMLARLASVLNEEPRSADEGSDRRSAAVAAGLASVLVASPWLERQAVLIMMRLCRDGRVDAGTVRRALQSAAGRLGADWATLMTSRLPFLIDQWLLGGGSIDDFPYQVFGLERLEFYEEHMNLLLPAVFLRRGLQAASALCLSASTDVNEQMLRSVTPILAAILPAVAVRLLDQPLGVERSVVTAACDQLAQLEHAVGRQAIRASLQEKAGELIGRLVATVGDPGETMRLFGPDALLPVSGSFVYVKDAVVTTVRHLSVDLLIDVDAEPFAYVTSLLNDRPWDVHRLVVDALVACETACRLSDKQHALVGVSVLVDVLLAALVEAEAEPMRRYLVHLLVFRLCHVTRDADRSPALRRGALAVLRTTLSTSLKHWPRLVADLLTVVVGNLTPLAEASGPLQWTALELLHFLVVGQRDSLVNEAIVQLSPFPAAFQRLSEAHRKLKEKKPALTLRQELEHLIALVDLLGCDNVPVESLDHLTQLLTQRKAELEALYRDVAEGGGSCSDCSHSVLHRLICRLILLGRSQSERVVQAAAAALGELGPTDLTTLILQVQDTDQDGGEPLAAMKTFVKGHALLELALVAVPLLVRHLSGPDVALLEQCGQVLRLCLQTHTGHQFVAVAKKFAWPWLHLLTPFRAASSGRDPTPAEESPTLDVALFEATIDDADLWLPAGGQSQASTWLCGLTGALVGCFGASSPVLSGLAPLIRRHAELCGAVLPFVVQLVLSCGAGIPRVRTVLSSHVNALVAAHCTDAASDTVRTVLKTTLSLVDHLRHCARPRAVQATAIDATAWSSNFWLDLNYLHLAQAAQLCNAHFSTVLYAELWLDPLNRTGQQMETTATENLTGLVFGDEPPERSMAHDLLFRAYSNIGEPDGFTGFQSLMSSPAWDIRRYEQEGRWFEALESYDAVASYSTGSTVGCADGSHPSILTWLSRCSLYRTVADLAGRYSGPEVREHQFECAWRLGQWHQDGATVVDAKATGVQQLLFQSLAALRAGDSVELRLRVNEGRQQVMRQLAGASLESCRNVYPSLTSLRLIRDVEDVGRRLLHGSNSFGADQVEQLRCQWSAADRLSSGDFAYLEPRLALRSVLLNELPAGVGREGLVETLLQMCREARQSAHYQVANRCLTHLATLELDAASALQCRLERALTEWRRGRVDTALAVLRSLVAAVAHDAPTSALHSQVLSLYGQWLAETRAENPRRILAKCFRKAVDVAAASTASVDSSAGEAVAALAAARATLASYADSMYKDAVSYLESREFQMHLKLTQIRKEKAEEMSKLRSTSTDQELRKATHFLTHETAKDQSEHSTLIEEREAYLIQAAENYLICVAGSSASSTVSFDVRISRLIALWFHNRQSAPLTQLLRRWLPKVASHHFVPVLPQLAARLALQPKPQLYHDEFPQLLMDLVERCALQHPHHTLPVVTALALTNKDREFLGTGGRSSGVAAPEEERVQASLKLLQRLKKSPGVGDLSRKWEQLAVHLIRFANEPPADAKVKNRPVLAELVRLEQCQDVAVPTVMLPVDPSGAYTDVVGIVRFEPHYELVGGVNAPKKLTVLGTDGRRRPLLLKGKDDLRQDAVMQQVFNVINSFLSINEETRRRRLRIRTYKVVPLSRRSGVLEWCENTLPIQQYLLGKDNNSGAHVRYQPQDSKPNECMKKLMDLAQVKTLEERMRRYQALCARFKPVFRHFFFERFTSPSVWYEKRLAYTRSVATSSMVGYILGLGDRHLMNILIDELTAELIHIDLGIAFDQGTVLPVPETVPFRLTRDIVDAMGAAGIEGVFRRCCQFTMQLMRHQQDSILTLLEVLLYDPLYVWTVTPQKAAVLQGRRGSEASRLVNMSFDDNDQSESHVNESAKRTLLRLGQKLKGVEKGTPLSVNGQVNLLIQQAMDPGNLCRMYHGWRPHA